MTALAPTLEAFFTIRLTSQYGVSAHTVASYRDAFKILLRYAFETTGTRPAALDISQLDVAFVTGFLDYLERKRGNTTRTRNARLAAVHSFATYASYRHPEHASQLSQILVIPRKRHQVTDIDYLTDTEVKALLAAPDVLTWCGQRDQAIFRTLVETGMRVGELVGVTAADMHLGTGAHVTCHGKGRKDRTIPLTTTAALVLKNFGVERAAPETFVFSTRSGKPLSRDAVEARLTHHVAVAATQCPTLGTKKVTPHVLRHTCAMRLLAAGVDIALIALWLGHESIESTQIYLHADMRMKTDALNRTAPLGTPTGQFIATDELLKFLENL